MTLALRRIRPNDFDVIQAGEIVGRIYRMKADQELWRWYDQVVGTPRAARAAGYLPPSTNRWRPSGRSGMHRGDRYAGVADSLDEAKAAFRAAWEGGL
jgi:hypothetical protein